MYHFVPFLSAQFSGFRYVFSIVSTVCLQNIFSHPSEAPTREARAPSPRRPSQRPSLVRGALRSLRRWGPAPVSWAHPRGGPCFISSCGRVPSPCRDKSLLSLLLAMDTCVHLWRLSVLSLGTRLDMFLLEVRFSACWCPGVLKTLSRVGGSPAGCPREREGASPHPIHGAQPGPSDPSPAGSL